MPTPTYVQLDDAVKAVMNEVVQELGISQRVLVEIAVLQFLNFFPQERDNALAKHPDKEEQWLKKNKQAIKSDLVKRMMDNYEETRYPQDGSAEVPEVQ